MIKVLLECSKYEGNPLFMLADSMNWDIQFSRQDLAELEKFMTIMGPLEKLFSSLDSDQHSTIQKVYPDIKV